MSAQRVSSRRRRRGLRPLVLVFVVARLCGLVGGRRRQCSTCEFVLATSAFLAVIVRPAVLANGAVVVAIAVRLGSRIAMAASRSPSRTFIS